MEYDITWQEKSYLPGGKAGYHLYNRSQNLRAYFFQDEVNIIPGNQTNPWWSWQYRLIGFGGKVLKIQQDDPEISAEKNLLQYRRKEFTELWTNSESGIKHSITVKEPLKDSSPVVFTFQVKGSLSPRKNSDGDLIFQNENGEGIRYERWKASDSRNILLSHTINLNEDEISIEIRDSGAVYPITIEGEITGFSRNIGWISEGNQTDSNFGQSVSSAGDVNGDGYDDILIGSPQYSNCHSYEGSVFLCYGAETGLREISHPYNADWSAECDQETAFFGQSVSAAGDVNGDGYADVIIGAPQYDNPGNDEGAAFVYYGSATGLSATPDVIIEIDQDNAKFGYSVSGAGDVNGDGFDDVIISAPYYWEESLFSRGAAFVFYGSETGIDPNNSWKALGNQNNAVIGTSVSGAGDVNGDGYDDVIVGARWYSNGNSLEGAAFVWLGGPLGMGSTGTMANAHWKAEGNQDGAHYGCSISSAGDVNSDGFSDIIIGAENYTNALDNQGAVFLYYGSPAGLSLTESLKIDGLQTSSGMGISVDDVSDINRDGYDDVIVGMGAYDGRGTVFIYCGSPSGIDPVQAWMGRCPNPTGLYGEAAGAAGDVNGDGAMDLLVGAPLYENDQTREGAAFVYYGAPGDWSVEGSNDYSNFGTDVGAAGDINGDGYGDVIVGASMFDNGQTGEGCAFLYMGSDKGLSTTPAWRAEGNQANAVLGRSVITAGDINGDGFSDIMIAAPNYTYGYTYCGRVFVWYGSASGMGANGTPDNADWRGDCPQHYAFFGSSISSAGDVNGDGYSDIIIGVPQYDNTETDKGAALVWYGSDQGLGANGTPDNADWKFEGESGSIQLGTSVAWAGDVNGDGYSDVIVSAPYSGNGKAFLFYGSQNGLSAAPDNTVECDLMGTGFGATVDTAGDVNGDGYSDVIISAPYYQNGRAFVYHGSASGLGATHDWSVYTMESNTDFGTSAHTAGDINGDGYGDVIIGAQGYKVGGREMGAAFVWFGSSSGLKSMASTANYDWRITTFQSYSRFGWVVRTAGDVNGDGFSDLIIASPGFAGGLEGKGAAYVFYGNGRLFSSEPDWKMEPDQNNAYYGRSVHTAGDVNGDGFSDIIVGAERYDNGEIDEGRVFVYHGSVSGPSLTPNWKAEGNQAGCYFGNAVGTAGDVNGDGYDDIIIGAKEYSNGELSEGAVFVWYGSSSGLSADGNPGNADWKGESNQEQGYLGYSVGTAGDVNGNGYSDIIAGAYVYENGEDGEGAVFAWYGSSSGLGADGNPGNADWMGECDHESAMFGWSVSTAGDVNGDGFSDVIIGARQYSYEGNPGKGAAFVYFGSYSGLNNALCWHIYCKQDSAYFGSSVSAAGDVNGDGYSDILVGAPSYKIGSKYGTAFAWYGSAGGFGATGDPETANWNAQVIPRSWGLGNSAASAGDMNGDGYADVIIGHNEFTGDLQQEGRVLVYLGSDSGLRSSPDWSVEGNGELARLGTDVSCAGDVNGDGFADIIIGAYTYRNGLNEKGNAWVSYGNKGTGFSFKPRQVQYDDSAPIAHLGLMNDPTQFRIVMNAQTPYGRGKVKLECEQKPLSMPLDGSDTSIIPNWELSYTTSTLELNQIVSVSSSDFTHHWRARLLYESASLPYQRQSPWIRIPWDGVQEADVRRVASPLVVTFEEIKNYILKRIDLSPLQKIIGDKNSDGIIDIADLIQLMK
ncbi:FG-GAP repeat protein [Candidatus Sumerlaeota bacterium]|nr:FG-GAP repeat protein [Candidatus Sumerlaeota bacterium]